VCRRLIPGVVLSTARPSLQTELAKATIAGTAPLGFEHVIWIEERSYLRNVRARVSSDGGTLRADDLVCIEPLTIARQAILAVFLVSPAYFSIGGVYTFERCVVSARDHCTGGAPIAGETLSRTLRNVLMWKSPAVWNVVSPSRVMAMLDRYFRCGIWSVDRMALALRSMWSSLCTPFPEQSFLGFMTALESLLLTQSTEITHTLAERVAALVGRTAQERIEAYGQTKRLYKTRSQLIHGKAFPKRGTFNARSLYVSSKEANIPIDQLHSALALSLSVLRGVLVNPTLLRLMQARQSEGKINENIDDFFLGRLFR